MNTVPGHRDSRPGSDGQLEEPFDRDEPFRTIADSAPVMIWVAQTEMLRTFFNRTWLEFTGRTMEQEVGDGWSAGIHPQDRDRCRRTSVSSLDGRGPFSMRYRLRRADGEYRWVLDRGVARYGEDGRFAGYVGSTTDISDLKLTEGALQQALSFEHLIADLMATFVQVSAVAVDDHIVDALARVSLFLDVDRSAVRQLTAATPSLEISHQWVRDDEQQWRVPAVTPSAAALPWLLEELLRGEMVVYSTIDELPPEATAERTFAERYGLKSCVCLPLVVDGAVIGSVSFGATRA
ncbi:MAG: hypothetical protein C5B48_11845, partial [Candidatus Rokuibacteriota bacterium]